MTKEDVARFVNETISSNENDAQSVSDVAELIGVNRSTLYRAIQQGPSDSVREALDRFRSSSQIAAPEGAEAAASDEEEEAEMPTTAAKKGAAKAAKKAPARKAAAKKAPGDGKVAGKIEPAAPAPATAAAPERLLPAEDEQALDVLAEAGDAAGAAKAAVQLLRKGFAVGTKEEVAAVLSKVSAAIQGAIAAVLKSGGEPAVGAVKATPPDTPNGGGRQRRVYWQEDVARAFARSVGAVAVPESKGANTMIFVGPFAKELAQVWAEFCAWADETALIRHHHYRLACGKEGDIARARGYKKGWLHSLVYVVDKRLDDGSAPELKALREKSAATAAEKLPQSVKFRPTPGPKFASSAGGEAGARDGTNLKPSMETLEAYKVAE